MRELGCPVPPTPANEFFRNSNLFCPFGRYPFRGVPIVCLSFIAGKLGISGSDSRSFQFKINSAKNSAFFTIGKSGIFRFFVCSRCVSTTERSVFLGFSNVNKSSYDFDICRSWTDISWIDMWYYFI